MCSKDSGCRRNWGSGRSFLAALPVMIFCLLVAAASGSTWAQIDPGGACDPNKIDSGCLGDGNPCNSGACDPATHICVLVPKVCANDGNCSIGSCNPANGQ